MKNSLWNEVLHTYLEKKNMRGFNRDIDVVEKYHLFYIKYYYEFVVKFDYILFCVNFNKSQNRPQKLSQMTKK